MRTMLGASLVVEITIDGGPLGDRHTRAPSRGSSYFWAELGEELGVSVLRSQEAGTSEHLAVFGREQSLCGTVDDNVRGEVTVTVDEGNGSNGSRSYNGGVNY